MLPSDNKELLLLLLSSYSFFCFINIDIGFISELYIVSMFGLILVLQHQLNLAPKVEARTI